MIDIGRAVRKQARNILDATAWCLISRRSALLNFRDVFTHEAEAFLRTGIHRQRGGLALCFEATHSTFAPDVGHDDTVFREELRDLLVAGVSGHGKAKFGRLKE